PPVPIPPLTIPPVPVPPVTMPPLPDALELAAALEAATAVVVLSSPPHAAKLATPPAEINAAKIENVRFIEAFLVPRLGKETKRPLHDGNRERLHERYEAHSYRASRFATRPFRTRVVTPGRFGLRGSSAAREDGFEEL